MKPAKAAGCHQRAPGSNPSSTGLVSHRTVVLWDGFWPPPPSAPSPCRQMVDLGIDSSAGPSIVLSCHRGDIALS